MWPKILKTKNRENDFSGIGAFLLRYEQRAARMRGGRVEAHFVDRALRLQSRLRAGISHLKSNIYL